MTWCSRRLSVVLWEGGGASGVLLAFLARVVHTWEFGALFRRDLGSGSLVSGVWVLLVDYRCWVLLEMLPFCRAQCLLDSEYMFCISTGRVMDELDAFSTSNPEVWISVLAQNGEVCSVLPQVLEFRSFSQELHGAGRVHDDG